jgi:hypothetical protein
MRSPISFGMLGILAVFLFTNLLTRVTTADSISASPPKQLGSGITELGGAELMHATGGTPGYCWANSSGSCLQGALPTVTCTPVGLCTTGTTYGSPTGPAPYIYCYGNGNTAQNCADVPTWCESWPLYNCTLNAGGFCVQGGSAGTTFTSGSSVWVTTSAKRSNGC